MAEALTAIYAADLNAVGGQIAHHYESAGQIELAIEFYQRAAETAQRTYANDDAIGYYRHLMEPPFVTKLSPQIACEVLTELSKVLSLAWTD